nr:MAG TPA_asm: hypothetical protein [Caudoviricetes sp.]
MPRGSERNPSGGEKRGGRALFDFVGSILQYN